MNNTLYSEIKRCLIAVPTQWDGKDGILEMKETGYPHWRQMEWIGFYFQFLCEKHLKKLFQFQKPRYDKVSFDGFYKIPFDFNTYSFPPPPLNIPQTPLCQGVTHNSCRGSAPTGNAGWWHLRTLFFVIQCAHFSIFLKNHVRR